MVGNIEIHPGIVNALVPVLSDPTVLEAHHDLAERDNSFFHFARGYFIESLEKYTGYDSEVINAISTGVRSYEVLGATTGALIPAVFGLLIVANIEKNPNYGVDIAEAMQEQVNFIATNRPYLTRGFKKLGQIQLADVKSGEEPRADLVDYSIGGAAIMRAAHQEAYQMWRFEMDYFTNNDF